MAELITAFGRRLLGAEPDVHYAGDSPGSLGVNDHALPSAGKKTGKKKREKKTKNLSLPKPRPSGDLAVSQGQVTFDAEGSDDKSSPWYSRHIHWPGNSESGVTLGRGYDMGNRSDEEVASDLADAGLDAIRATAFSQGAKKKGAIAQKFVKDNQKALGEITQGQQKKLFENIYPSYVSRAKTNYDYWTFGEKSRIEWEKLSAPVRDVLVDFVYQGFTKGPRPMIAGMHDNIDDLIDYIQGSATMKSYEDGRQRIAYLKQAKATALAGTP